MSTIDLDKCYEEVMALVKKAGKMVKTAIYKSKSIEMKTSARDLVTETDKAVEDFLINSLSKKFPSHKFIGEETIAPGKKIEFTNQPTWIIDPVDGTLNFVHTYPYICVSIALWVNKEAKIGIVFNPILDQMFTARKNKGAFLNGSRIHVSGEKDLSKSLVMAEVRRQAAPKMKLVLNNLESIVKTAHGVRCMGAAALNISHVAWGGVEAYYEIGLHAWDMAAGALIVEEAGGHVCDINGGPFNVMSRRILCASSKELAKQLVDILQAYEEEWD